MNEKDAFKDYFARDHLEAVFRGIPTLLAFIAQDLGIKKMTEGKLLDSGYILEYFNSGIRELSGP